MKPRKSARTKSARGASSRAKPSTPSSAPARRKRRARARDSPPQLALPLPNRHGGARPGAGRPRSGKGYVPHRRRPGRDKSIPMLITLRLVRTLPRLRSKRPYDVFERALRGTQEMGGLRFTHYSVQDDHMHLMTEVRPDEAPAGTVPGGLAPRLGAKKLLTARMRGFAVRLARRMNKLLGRRGKVVAERYHVQPLHTPRQVRNALVYVLANRRKHLARFGRTWRGGWVDPFSSGVFFDSWREPPDLMWTVAEHDPPPVVLPRTWLLRVGWRLRHGDIGTDEVPRAARAA
jgi:hypothetical protein